MKVIEPRGFTLIELLLVIAIIEILASITIPKFTSLKAKAYIASMTAGPGNLAVSEEAYFDDAETYYGNGLPSALPACSPSPGVTSLNEETGAEWSASTQTVGTARPCMVFYGNAAPAVPAMVEGVSACIP